MKKRYSVVFGDFGSADVTLFGNITTDNFEVAQRQFNEWREEFKKTWCYQDNKDIFPNLTGDVAEDMGSEYAMSFFESNKLIEYYDGETHLVVEIIDLYNKPTKEYFKESYLKK